MAIGPGPCKSLGFGPWLHYRFTLRQPSCFGATLTTMQASRKKITAWISKPPSGPARAKRGTTDWPYPTQSYANCCWDLPTAVVHRSARGCCEGLRATV